MKIRSWIRNLFARPATRPIRKAPRRVRLAVEALEYRWCPSTFTVNSTADLGTGSGLVGDLRYCINQANHFGGTETIVFDSTVFNTAKTITLGGTLLELSDTTGTETITGPAAGVTVDGGGQSQVFQIDLLVTASLSGVTITGGHVAKYDGNGGGLFNYGWATLTNCTVSGNSGGGGGGGIYSSRGSLTLNKCTVSGNALQQPVSIGGGLFIHSGMATLTNCTVSGNSCSHDGGGLFNGGTTTLTNCTVSGNSADHGVGGGIFGAATLTNCTVSGNSADHGGGLYNPGTLGNTIVAGNTAAFGPDVLHPFASLGNNLIGKTDGSSGWVASDLTGTVAAPLDAKLGVLGNNGGPTQTMALLAGSPAIDAGSNSIAGLTIPTTDQRGALRGPAGVNAGSTVDIGAYEASSLFLVTSAADSNEFGTLPTAVSWANVSTNNNPANISSPAANTVVFDTAGVFATPQTITLAGTQLTLTNTSVAETITSLVGVTVSGGGLSQVFHVNASVTASISGVTFTDGQGSSGFGGAGGVINHGMATLTNCTVSGNSGGGLYNTGTATLTNCTVSGNSGSAGGGVFNTGMATLTNCTVSGNSSGDGDGGGVFNTGTATLTDCTVSGNSSGDGGGGGLYNTGTATLGNTIVAGNTTANGPDAFGTFASLGHNLIGQTDGSSGWVASDLTGTIAAPLDAKLGVLGNNGGLTQTMALLAGSPALDAGSNSIAGLTIPTTDQRDALRGPAGLNAGSAFDIGAFEASSSALVTSIADSNDVGTLRAAVSWANGSTTNNNPANISSPAANAVVFDTAGVFATPQTITLAGAQLTLTNTSVAETITSVVGVTVSGGGLSRVFQVDAAVTASLSELTISGGNVSGYNGANGNYGANGADGGSAAGAGIENAGSITLTNCTVSGNTASGGTGGASGSGYGLGFFANGGTGGSAAGAGIDNTGSVTLTNCTVSGNTANGGSGGSSGAGFTFGNGGSAAGAGIENAGSITLTNCTVSCNTASGGSGFVPPVGTGITISTGGSAAGAGIDNASTGSVTFTNCTVSGNTASGGTSGYNGIGGSGAGAGIENAGSVTFTNCTVSGNTASGGTGVGYRGGNGGSAAGAGIDNASTGSVTLTNSTVSGNTASGGSAASGYSGNGGSAAGAGIDNASTGSVTLTNCTVSGNNASGGVGGYYSGNGGSAAGAGIDNASTGSVTLTSCTVSGNSASGATGGGYSALGGSAAGAAGAGIENASTGSVTLTNCTVSGNSASGSSGGNGGYGVNGGNGGSAAGAGIDNAFRGSVTLTNCTVSGNSASGGSGGSGGSAPHGSYGGNGGNGGSAAGAGIDNAYTGSVTLTNCTVSGNSASGGSGGSGGSAGYGPDGNGGNGGSAAGAGIDNAYTGSVALTNCTVSGNTANGATGGHGGGYSVAGINTASAGTVTLTNTIVADAVAGTLSPSGSYNVLVGTSPVGGLSDGSNGNIIKSTAAALFLAPLGDYGGPTQTIALLPGSPAIDAGTSTGAPATDQRGLPRVGAVDIGAFEFQSTLTTTTTTVTTSVNPSTYGDSVTFTATVTSTSTPTGSVNFVIDTGAPVAGIADGTTGTTTTWIYTTSTLSAGTHTVAAFYSGSGGFADSNGTLSGGQVVNMANVTITAKPESSMYGTTPSVDQTLYTVAGLVNNDQLTTNPTLTLTGVTSASHVGTYAGAITASGAAASSDYTISYVAGNWSVTTANVTITAKPQSSIYGTTPSVDQTLYTVAGLVNNDQLTTVPTLTLTGVTSTSHVGTYTGAITASGAAASADYTISYAAGDWSVTTATVTITAKPQSSQYGTTPSVNQTLYTVTGLVNNDQLTTVPTLTLTGVTSASHVNTYTGAITASGAAASADYTISYAAGDWSVTTATVTITAKPQSSVYGTTPSVNQTLYTVAGLVNNDQLTTNPTLTLTGVTSTSPVGTYTGAITASGAAASSDYTISYAAGDWSVTSFSFSIRGSSYDDLTENGFSSDDPSLGAADTNYVSVTINLYQNGGATPFATTTTDASGNYSFTGLGAGTYTVKEVVTAGWKQTANRGGATSGPSGTASVTATNGGSSTGNDFDNFKYGQISGTLFHDLTGDGFSADDPALTSTLQAVTLKLFKNGSASAFATATQNSAGAYSFSGLDYGTYSVQEVVPANWVQTASRGTAVTGTVTAASGLSATGNDFDDAHIGAKGNPQGTGYWKNNGDSLITASDITTLNMLNLRDTNGNLVTFSTTSIATARTQVANFLSGANSKNPANALSAQLVAMELNVLHGGVSTSSVIYAPALAAYSGALNSTAVGGVGALYNGGFITIGTLMNAVKNELGLYGNPSKTVTQNGILVYNFENELQNALISANSNQNFVI